MRPHIITKHNISGRFHFLTVICVFWMDTPLSSDKMKITPLSSFDYQFFVLNESVVLTAKLKTWGSYVFLVFSLR